MRPEEYLQKADHALTSAGMLYDGAEADDCMRNGPLAPGLGRAINEAEKARISADYTNEFADLETARLVLDRARRFVAAIRGMLQAGS